MFRYDETKQGEFIGSGENAKTYEYGKQESGKRNYLVKCMPAVNLDKLKQYIEEFALGFNNKHPFILNYKRFDLQEDNQEGKKKYMFYIKMKKMKQNLRKFIQEINSKEGKKQHLSLERIIWIFYSLSSALAYLEEKDIVYSNITFDSVFIEDNDTIKLGVFPFSYYKPWNTWNTPINKMYQSYKPPERFLKEPPKIIEKKKPEKKDEKDDVPADKVANSLFDDDEDEKEDEKKKVEKKIEKKVEKKERDPEKKESEKKDDNVLADNVANSLFDDDEDEKEDEKKKVEKKIEKKVEKKVEKKEKDPEKKEYDKKVAWKSDVWCLGKLIIDICLLRCKIPRDEQSWDVMRNVKKDLKEVETIYSKDPSLERLMGIFRKIFLTEREKRLDFKEIREELKSKYPEFELLEMENRKEAEERLSDLNESEIAQEEEKAEDFDSSLPSELVSKIAKKISEEHRTIREDFQMIKQNMENSIKTFRKSCRQNFKEIIKRANEVLDYKVRVDQIENSKGNIEKFLKKTETLLKTCSVSFENLELTENETRMCFGKFVNFKDVTSSLDESSEDISKKTSISKDNMNSFEEFQESFQRSLNTNVKHIYEILKDPNKD